MSRTLIADAKEMAGKTVTLKAWVQTIRHQGKIVFLVLRDISGTVQGVAFDKSVTAAIDGLTIESVVQVAGEMKEAKQAPGGVEIGISGITVLSEAEPELAIPIDEKAGATGQEKRLDWRWLDLRKPQNQLIFKIWTTAEEAIREYWTANQYLQIHSPKLINTASESGAEVFKVEYFEGEAFLAQSPQFYKQMAMASGFERVFEVGPVFRAEPSFTTRHVTEFTGWDAELSFVESHEDVMAENERMLIAVLERVVKEYGDDIKAAFDRTLKVPKAPFPRLTMAEVKDRLAKAGVKSEQPGDLSPEEERKIGEISEKETGHEFLFVTDWPYQKRAFYHMRLEPGSELTRGYDLIWNGVEIVTGAQREHRYDILVEQAKGKKMDLKPLTHYLNFFRYGCPPHGGMGMGPARIMMQLIGAENVREVSFLTRTPNRLTP